MAETFIPPLETLPSYAVLIDANVSVDADTVEDASAAFKKAFKDSDFKNLLDAEEVTDATE